MNEEHTSTEVWLTTCSCQAITESAATVMFHRPTTVETHLLRELDGGLRLRHGDLVDAPEDHHFTLPTTKGTSVSEYRFSNVTFHYGDSTIHAGIAQSFATQGIPMPAYGAMCHKLYGT